jgi:transcription antitermination factor NusG
MGYVFVEGELNPAIWHSVVDGNVWRGGENGPIRGFLGFTDEDTPWAEVPASLVEEVIGRCDAASVLIEEAVLPPRCRSPGQRVRLLAGPFAGRFGQVRADDGRTVQLRLDNGWPLRIASDACLAVEARRSRRQRGRHHAQAQV